MTNTAGCHSLTSDLLDVQIDPNDKITEKVDLTIVGVWTNGRSYRNKNNETRQFGYPEKVVSETSRQSFDAQRHTAEGISSSYIYRL